MAEQLKLSLSDDVRHCPLPLHLSSDFGVGDVVLPVDLQYVSVTPHLKCHQSTLISFLRGPGRRKGGPDILKVSQVTPSRPL